ELATLSTGDLVAPEVARALNVQPSDRRPALASITNAVSGQSILIVLDNCEHVLEAAAALADAAVRAAPGVRVLATSQESLKTPDEHIYRLDTLAIPPDDDVENAERYGAVQLFVARVRAADRSFIPGADNRTAIIDVCRKLDGIPLALELAAART